VQITLRSGAQLVVDVAALELGLGPIPAADGQPSTGVQYVKAKWGQPADGWASRLVGVIPQEIVAVVQLADVEDK
jgi:hypothetical protein